MRSGPRFFSLWFLITLTFTTSSAHASFIRSCTALLAKARVPLQKNETFYLDESSRLAVLGTIKDPKTKPEELVSRLNSLWLSTRLRGLEEQHQSLVRAYDYHMANESFYGLRVDDPLEMLVRRPGLNHSLVQLVDYAHRLESEILNMEFTDKIPRRPGLTLRSLAPTFRAAALKAEWEILHAIPRVFAREELVRIKGLRMDRRLHKFAERLLSAPDLSYQEYVAMQRPLLFGAERVIDWRITNDPSIAARDDNRVALLRLLEQWTQIDDDVHWTIKTSERLRAMSQVRGDRPAGAAVDLVERTRELRREALEREWQNVHTWRPRRRDASLVMLEQFDLHPAFKARVRRAIQSSSLAHDDYFKVRLNRRRLTTPWTY